MVMDSTFIVKQSHHNYTLGNQQQYIYKINMWKKLTLVKDSNYLGKKSKMEVTHMYLTLATVLILAPTEKDMVFVTLSTLHIHMKHTK